MSYLEFSLSNKGGGGVDIFQLSYFSIGSIFSGKLLW